MKLKLTRRLGILLALFAGAACLVAFSPPPQKAEVVAPIRVARSSVGASATTTDKDDKADSGMILALRPRARNSMLVDAFALQNWTPPPPPPPPAAPPPKPTAPPLPFTVLGKKLEDGTWQVFLGQQDRTYIVRARDMIGSDYRVDTIAPPSVVMTYLPLNQQQTLSIGNAE